MSFVKAVRSDIFFLSVTALMCFVLDHLLCPASGAGVVPKYRRHRWQMGLVIDDLGPGARMERATSGRAALRIALKRRQHQFRAVEV